MGSNCAPKGSVNSVRSVREKTSQRVTCVSSHNEGVFYFSQKNTDEQNTQTFTETLSQPISQNVTANVSWKASVSSVCRRRSVGSNCAPKGSVNSVRSVREKPLQRERKNSPATCMSLILSRGCVLFLTEEHRRTELTKLHRDIKSTDNTEPYSQHSSPNTHL